MTPRDKRVRDPLRILLLADAASPIVGKWVSHCLNMHYETHIMSLNTDIQNVNGAVIHPLRASKASSAKRDYLRALPRVWREVRRIRPDILHVHYGGGYGLLGSLVPARRRVLSLWGSDVLVAPRKSAFRSLLLRWMISRSDAVCVNSLHLAEAASLYTSRSVNVTYFGVSPEFFCDHGGERPVGSPLRIVMVKNLDENSGITTLLSAIQAAAKAGIDLHLKAVGRDSNGWARSMAASLGVANSVEFVEFLRESELSRVFSQSDVYVQHTRYTEGFGLAVAEAQAAGLPAVVSSVGGLIEAVDLVGGSVVPPGDPVSLSQALISYAADMSLLVGARESARRHAKKYAWEVVAPAMDEVYRRLHEGCGSRGGQRR